MTVVITTNEPLEVRQLFVDRIEVPMGFDILLYTKAGSVANERKKTPIDFIASVEDGRLHREILAMREESQYNILIQHGVFEYYSDGALLIPGVPRVKNRHGGWNRKGVRKLKWTIEFIEGLYIAVAENDEDLVDTVNDLQDFFDNLENHNSLRMRPGMVSILKGEKGKNEANRQERVQYFYQGLPSIKYERAKLLESRFPNPIMIYQATIEEIMEVSGIGKKLATGIYNFLREG